MAEIDFKCLKCGKTLRIDDAHAGKATTCPSCGASINIPSRPQEPAPQPRIVPTPPPTPVSAGAADQVPLEEKDVFSIRPTLKACFGRIVLAVLLSLFGVALEILVKAKGSLRTIIIGAGLAAGLVVYLTALYQKFSILYKLSTQRFFLHRGLISRKVDELELFRVRDVQVTQNIWERIMKFGKMTIYSTDATSPKFVMTGIPDPLKVKDAIRSQYRIARLKERVRPTEFISDFDVDDFAGKDPSL